MPAPYRVPVGITNQNVDRTWGQAGVLDPFFYNIYQNDFDTLDTTDFIVTDVGTNTTAITQKDGGAIIVTTSAGANDASYHQVPGSSFRLIPNSTSQAGKKTFFKFRVQASDSSLTNIYAGLIIPSATPLTAPDGLFFLKASGAATWVLRSIVGGVATDKAMPTSVVSVNNQDLELGFYVDYNGVVSAWVGDVTGYKEKEPNGYVVDGFVAQFQPGLTTALLTPSFGLKNGAAASKTITVDFIAAARER